MTPEAYFKKLQSHDWYYQYSDDHGAWQKGRSQAMELQSIAAEGGIYGKMYEEYSAAMFDKEIPKPQLEQYLKFK